MAEGRQRTKKRHQFKDSLVKSILFLAKSIVEAPFERLLVLKQTIYRNPQYEEFKIPRDRSSIKLAKLVYQDGMRSFYRGLPPMFPSSMILFFTSGVSLTNGKALYDYLAFVGFLDSQSKTVTSFWLVTAFTHVM